MENLNKGDMPVFKTETDLTKIAQLTARIRSEAASIISGQANVTDLLTAAVLADGHVLIEGVPGTAKTLAARMLSKLLGCDFKRIQFTPDLMPSDILGTSVFNPQSQTFEFRKGPIFSNIILADEINRAPAKTQSALLEVMEERRVTMDGITYLFEEPFMVIATQNPVEHEGTYALPEAETDRFMFRIKTDYPTRDEEIKILQMKQNDSRHSELNDLKPVLDAKEIREMRKLVHSVKVDDKIMAYVADITCATRESLSLYLGASPRASIALMNASKAFAAMNGRDFVIPEDVRFMAYHVLNHRVIISPEKEMEGISDKDIINSIIDKIESPR